VDLHRTCDARDHLRLFVDGALVAEIAVAPCRARDTLAALARQVRALGDQLLAAPPHPVQKHRRWPVRYWQS
jgi:predicted acylesterase/phospholipase RssA